MPAYVTVIGGAVDLAHRASPAIGSALGPTRVALSSHQAEPMSRPACFQYPPTRLTYSRGLPQFRQTTVQVVDPPPDITPTPR